ncbi:MAG: hypothetical protein ACTHY4_00360 [Flavobacteriaceae bacterium]
MLLTIGIIIAILILVNILLLIFSCNPSENEENKQKTAVKPVAPKGLQNKKSKYILYADK